MTTKRDETLAGRLSDAFKQYRKPHQLAGPFLLEASLAGGCDQHVALCARSLSGLGCITMALHESYLEYLTGQLDEALKSEACWEYLKPVVENHLRRFQTPPEDCRETARDVLHFFAPHPSRNTDECSPPPIAEAMQAQASAKVQQAAEELIASLAGCFVQHSLTPIEHRGTYVRDIAERAEVRVNSISVVDQTCAFTLHTPNRWQAARYRPPAVAQLLLWSDQASTWRNTAVHALTAQNAALLIAMRFLNENAKALMDPETLQDRERCEWLCQATAYWFEVARNLFPANPPNAERSRLG